MTETTLTKIGAWIVIIWSVGVGAGIYRYFRTPVELRFGGGEGLWLAASLVGDVLLATMLLFLLRDRGASRHD